MNRAEQVLVRPAQMADAEAVFALLCQFAVSYHPRREAFDRHYPQLLRADHATCLVAEVAGRVVGYALAFRLLTLFANGPVTELQELMVDPAHRRRGIGRRLVEAVVERARQAGALEVTVPTRRARDYYRRLGFEETATYLKLKQG
ncbi:MAG TPA: GNAT family N-acetyltransferase [Chloroflexota bacterium]|nr:GNAT family N-acetyltransferase [Chloroflexota bacterium]